jgi:hypothetical protein
MGANLFEAYLDESGTHEGSPILSVAGYFGTREQWNVFLDRWPYIEFHAREKKFDPLKPALADALDAAELTGIETCLRPWEFNLHANTAFKSNLGNAYAVGAFICALKICDLVKDNPDARVALVLEDGQPNVLWVQRLLIMMMLEFPIASVTVAKKSECVPLHSADFLSHSRSTTNIKWMDRLFLGKRVWEQPIDGVIFQQTSSAITELLKEHRRKKVAEKRQRKKDLNNDQ